MASLEATKDVDLNPMNALQRQTTPPTSSPAPPFHTTSTQTSPHYVTPAYHDATCSTHLPMPTSTQTPRTCASAKAPLKSAEDCARTVVIAVDLEFTMTVRDC